MFTLLNEIAFGLTISRLVIILRAENIRFEKYLLAPMSIKFVLYVSDTVSLCYVANKPLTYLFKWRTPCMLM